MPLSELAAFVAAERRLPNVPSADEIQQGGLNMTDMQMRLLEKVEELTLYTLEQQKTIEEFQERLGNLATLVSDLLGVDQATAMLTRTVMN